MTYRFDFGKGLKEVQLEQRVSSSELARRLNVHRQQINHWRGRKDAKLSLVVKVCDGLGVEVFDFLERSSH